MHHHLLQWFKLPLQHEFAEQKIINAIVSLVLSHMWGVFTAYFSEISWKTHEAFPPFRQHRELVFLQGLYFVSVIYCVWTSGKHSLSVPLVDVGAIDKTTLAVGAWLNIVMTQELFWKGRELRFQSLFSSALLGFIRRWSEAKRTNSSGHVAQESNFFKCRIP